MMNNAYIPTPFGFQVHVSDTACISNQFNQYRFPKSKKKRIRRKWANDVKNFRIEEKHVMVVNNEERKIFLSTKLYDKIIKYFE